jgi:peptidoglycan L-alanyl-D-glutamate endopeptidase CwlK
MEDFMGLHRDINLLEPGFRALVNNFLDDLEKRGIDYRVVETLRDVSVQNAYYAQGREPLVSVNRKRANEGLWLITEKENKNPITWTLQSKHLLGKAIDLAPVMDGKIWWNAPFTIWEQLGAIGESHGLGWGGRWKNRLDCPHYEAL